MAFAAAAIFIFESSRVRRCQLLDVTKGHLISSQILKIPLESFLGRHVAMPRASTYNISSSSHGTRSRIFPGFPSRRECYFSLQIISTISVQCACNLLQHVCVCNLLGVTWHRFPSYTPLYHARMTRPQRVLARRRTSPVLRLSLQPFVLWEAKSPPIQTLTAA